MKQNSINTTIFMENIKRKWREVKILMKNEQNEVKAKKELGARNENG